MTTFMRSTILACLVVFGATVAGCGGGASTIQGKVIRGDISFLTVVDSNDPRLRGEGLAGAKVEISAVAARGGTPLGKSISDEKGNISISVRDTGALLRPAEFSAELAGYGRPTAEMSIPAADKRLLVVLKPGAGGGASTPK